MAVNKIFGASSVDDLADNVLSEVDDFMLSVEKMQKRKVAGNVQLVIQALKKIESDLQDKFDGVTTVIEKRVSTIKDGRDGVNGRDGRDGKEGRPGKDGLPGRPGKDGLPGRDGVDGMDGVSVVDARIDFDGSLIIGLSSGREINVGEVVAPDLAERIKVITNGGGTSQGVLDTLTSLQSQITALQALGAVNYQGTWNASTNSPTITAGTGTKGYYYVVSVAGSTSIDGQSLWGVGDWIIFNGSAWQKVDGGSTGDFTNLSASGTVTLSGGTTLAVAYLNGSRVLTTGSALQFDGTTLGIYNGTADAQRLNLGTSGTNAVINATRASGTQPNVIFQIDGAERMRLTSTGLGVGATPTTRFTVGGYSSANQTPDIQITRSSSGTLIQTGPNITFSDGTTNNTTSLQVTQGRFGVWNYGAGAWNERMSIDASGNLGLGVTPSAWGAKAIEVGNAGSGFYSISSVNTNLSSNSYFNGTSDIYASTNVAAKYQMFSGSHRWYYAASGTAGNAITFTQAMTLDASGNLLVGVTSGSYHEIVKSVTNDAGNVVLEIVGGSNATSSIHYGVSSYNANAANAAMKVGRDGTTLRSINAGGTVNASGADYAEYMTKAGDFTIAKGDVVGIDAQGKLTNIFSDAVSFCVKSTDPSYVGGDVWGCGLEDDLEALEAARQAVDRIAFAGQVPVNVTGASPGQYIVPVNFNGSIKGEAVANPTFEQYQQAVGKVIAIEQDGRARIIVKVA